MQLSHCRASSATTQTHSFSYCYVMSCINLLAKKHSQFSGPVSICKIENVWKSAEKHDQQKLCAWPIWVTREQLRSSRVCNQLLSKYTPTALISLVYWYFHKISVQFSVTPVLTVVLPPDTMWSVVVLQYAGPWRYSESVTNDGGQSVIVHLHLPLFIWLTLFLSSSGRIQLNCGGLSS